MPQVSASVNAQTIIKINQMAKIQKRSFSEMVNILLTNSVSGNHKKKKPAQRVVVV